MDIIYGFLLGITTGVNCFLICCPFLFPFFITEKRSIKNNTILILKYLIGRLIAYCLLGLISGFFGVAIGELEISKKIYALILLLSSIILFLYSINIFFEFKIDNLLLNTGIKNFPLLVGFLTAFNLCPPLITAFSYSITTDNILKSLLFFILFFLGTSVYVIPFIFSGIITKFEKVRNTGKILGILVAVWLFINSIYMLFKY